jgi:hypothetical protein
MIRRDVFLQLGGFDPELYRRPAIEDIEFGYRLSRAGFHTVIARDVLATHLKHWTLPSVLKTDVFQRGVPWMLLMMRSQVVETDLNVSKTQRLCVASTGLGLAALPLTPLHPLASLPLLINLLILLKSNFPFYRFLASRKGAAFAAASFPLHYLYFCSCGISVAIAAAIKIAADQKAARSRRTQTNNPNPIPRPASLRYATRRRQRNKTSSNAPSRGKPPA